MPTHQATAVAPNKPHPFWTADRFEGFAGRAAKFVSGPWGTHVGFGLLAFWLGAAVGWAGTRPTASSMSSRQ
jgi:hypothetical protein